MITDQEFLANMNGIKKAFIEIRKRIEAIENRIGGLETLAADIHGDEALELHQSFPDSIKSLKSEKNYAADTKKTA